MRDDSSACTVAGMRISVTGPSSAKRESPPPSEQIKQAIFKATEQSGEWTRTGVAVAGESLWEFLHHRDDILRDEHG
jgi:hypothetical protein